MEKSELVKFIIDNFDDDIKWAFLIEEESMELLWYYIGNIESSKECVSLLPARKSDDIWDFYTRKMEK